MITLLFWLFLFTILYTYLGYPLLLRLLSSFMPDPETISTQTPLVTLLITAYNEESVIADKIENSLVLDYPRDRLQILVAADGSNDQTTNIVESFAEQGVELSYSKERKGKVAAINNAMARVRGDIIVFSDANNFYESCTLRELVAPFADLTVGAVCGAKAIQVGDGVLGESEGLYWRYESFIKKQETRLGCCTGVSGEVLAIRHNLFETLPRRIINDDFYMAMRIIRKGYRIIYAPEARSTERVSLSARDEITRRARIIAGRYQAITFAHKLLPLNRPVVFWQIMSHKFLRPLVPFFMIGVLMANTFVVLWPAQAENHSLALLTPPFNWLLLLLQIMFYGVAVIGNKINGYSTFSKLLYIPTFFVNSNLAALIGLVRFISKRQTPLWQRVQRRG